VPFELELPDGLSPEWKVKIREKERLEHPHVTIIRGTSSWRINLRDGGFMDNPPDPRLVPQDLLNYIKREDVWTRLVQEWNKKYPNNHVFGQAEGE
jgi:hypothetical protein